MSADPAAPAAAPVLELLLVDDHPLFSRGLALLIEAHGGGRVRVAASTANPAAAERLARLHRPDLALVDLVLPPPGGLEVIRAVKRAHPPLRVLAMSGAADEDMALEAVLAGADGFLPKTAEPEQLLPPVLSVASGYQVMPCPLADRLTAAGERPDPLCRTLDERQRDLLCLLAQGLSNVAIARRLFVSERTAKRLVADLLGTLGVRTRVAAAAKAGRLGLLDGDC